MPLRVADANKKKGLTSEQTITALKRDKAVTRQGAVPFDPF